jgi:hypothetical protein
MHGAELMSAARAERRRAARHAARGSGPWLPPASEYGGVFGTFTDGKVWSVHFPTTGEAKRFLTILGPPPATIDRIQAAVKIVKGERHG